MDEKGRGRKKKKKKLGKDDGPELLEIKCSFTSPR